MAVPDEGGGDLQLIGEIDRIIHEPARLLILSFLYVVEAADFIFLMRETGLTKGNLSSHLNKLEGAGYIDVVKEFVDRKPRTMLKISDPGRVALQAYRKNMEHVLGNLP